MGLSLIWKRLEECYGAPEAIEKALFEKIDNFPKVSNWDNQRLRELGDLLFEIEAANEDGYLHGLVYLDTARGISPLLEKLPFYLKQKWMTYGFKYKEDHNAPFPPCSVFSQFIREAKARNDPGFNGSSSMTPTLKREKMGSVNYRNPVFVHKTSVCKESTDGVGKQVEDPKTLCPIHKKPHPFKKCKSFRAMLLDDRKKFLRDKYICFHCCASVSHQAKNCDVLVKRTECNSERHIAALHPGPAPRDSKPLSPPKVHGGEPEMVPEDEQTSVGSTVCTQVCSKGFSAKSCSNICLVICQGHHEERKRNLRDLRWSE